MKAFLAIFNSLPAIVQSVHVIESTIPVPNAGQQKLDLILNAALTAWAASQMQQQISQNNLVNSIAAMTNLTVATMNAVGIFKKSAIPAAAVPPVSSK